MRYSFEERKHITEMEDKKHFGMTKEELIENALIAAVMAGVSFLVTFVGFGVKTMIQEKVKPR